MSGQLVGEVLAASDGLRARGLSERGFHALIAIAEKAHTDSRQGSVPWSHIQSGIYGGQTDGLGLMRGPTKRTAERALQDLKQLDLVRVVKSGFKNQHGIARAPIYEIARLADTDAQESVSTFDDHDTQVSASRQVDTDKPEGGYRQTGAGYRHPGVVLNGSTNGPLNREPRCAMCRDDGWLLGADGAPVEPARRCTHTPAMAAYLS